MSIRKSIVVPCYNEAANLPHLIGRFEEIARTNDLSINGETVRDWELILVDNGSTDDSAETFARELAKPGRDFARLVTVPSPNVGYGHGIMTGLRAAQGDWLAWTHADGQTPPRDVFRAFDVLLQSDDPKRTFVKGRRRHRPTKDALFTLGMQLAAAALLLTNLPDINGQPKAFPRALLDLATDAPSDLSLDLYFFHLGRKNGFAIETLDVDFGAREHGESKWAFNWRSKAKNIARSVKYMKDLRSRS